MDAGACRSTDDGGPASRGLVCRTDGCCSSVVYWFAHSLIHTFVATPLSCCVPKTTPVTIQNHQDPIEPRYSLMTDHFTAPVCLDSSMASWAFRFPPAPPFGLDRLSVPPSTSVSPLSSPTLEGTREGIRDTVAEPGLDFCRSSPSLPDAMSSCDGPCAVILPLVRTTV